MTRNLSDCVSNSRVFIISVSGGRTLQRRCSDMGLVPGSDACIQSNFGGRIYLTCNGTSYAIGKGMAHKILVSTQE
ncbi:MAG: FeoA family protein [Synergistota bacterium]|nr:FeoA family protein [Synergistota bacterium]